MILTFSFYIPQYGSMDNGKSDSAEMICCREHIKCNHERLAGPRAGNE
jgi:hypothetical protein